MTSESYDIRCTLISVKNNKWFLYISNITLTYSHMQLPSISRQLPCVWLDVKYCNILDFACNHGLTDLSTVKQSRNGARVELNNLSTYELVS